MQPVFTHAYTHPVLSSIFFLLCPPQISQFLWIFFADFDFLFVWCLFFKNEKCKKENYVLLFSYPWKITLLFIVVFWLIMFLHFYHPYFYDKICCHMLCVLTRLLDVLPGVPAEHHTFIIMYLKQWQYFCSFSWADTQRLPYHGFRRNIPILQQKTINMSPFNWKRTIIRNTC